MSVVAERHVSRSPAPAERDARVPAKYIAFRILDFHGAGEEIRTIPDGLYPDRPRDFIGHRRVGTLEMQRTRRTLEYGISYRVCIRGIDVDPRTPMWIEYPRERLDACRAVNAARRVPFDAYVC